MQRLLVDCAAGLRVNIQLSHRGKVKCFGILILFMTFVQKKMQILYTNVKSILSDDLFLKRYYDTLWFIHNLFPLCLFVGHV